ncbi:LysM peptidoglycan-binding domain-containing protein [bacterium]|nr:LysM peptidoglycan-binding domain-containing protein [bacterium]
MKAARSLLRLLPLPPLLMALAALALLCGGCSRPVLREARVAESDYYSEGEYNRLSRAQREAYCAELAAELDRLRVLAANAPAPDRRAELARLKAELVRQRERLLGAADSGLDSLRAEIAWYEALPDSYCVQRGDGLAAIAAQARIYADAAKWPRLARANRAALRDPQRLRPGQCLRVPRDWPRQHRVAPGEWLSKIAGYWEIYDDPLAWPRLYEANRDQIAGPELIRPDQVLDIPR